MKCMWANVEVNETAPTITWGFEVICFFSNCVCLTQKHKLLKGDLKCISRTHSLHEQIRGSIVHMNMFCILWMHRCFACQLPGSDNVPFVCCWATAFSLHHFKGGFCRLFLNVKGKQTFSSSFFTLFYTHSIISLSPFKLPLFGVLLRTF